MIGIIDYGAGNLRSVGKALEYLGEIPKITNDPKEIANFEAIILPGVGSFGAAMESIKRQKLDKPIIDAAKSGIPLLGICLGMQLFYEKSYEDGYFDGLGLLEGEIIKFASETLKIPQMGWNSLELNKLDQLGDGISQNEYVYFVHSYYAKPKDWDEVIYYTDYGIKVPAIVRKGNIIGMQFHPEKSSTTGFKLLKNFISEIKEKS
jgi:glutamine amidotransferase